MFAYKHHTSRLTCSRTISLFAGLVLLVASATPARADCTDCFCGGGINVQQGTVQLSGTFCVATVTIASGATLNFSGTLTICGFGGLTCDGIFNIAANSTVYLCAGGSHRIGGTVNLQDSGSELSVEASGTIGGTGVIDGTHDAALITIDSTKELILEASITGNLSIEGAGNFTNQGTVQADNSGTLLVDISGTLDDDSTADWNATTTSGALLQFGNSLDDNNMSISLDGDFTISQAGAEIQIDEMTGLTSAFTTTGKLTLSAGTLDVDEDVTMGSVGYTLNMTGGTIEVAAGKTFTHH